MVTAPSKPVVDDDLQIRFPAEQPLTDELFTAIQTLNEDVRFERASDGALVIAPLPGTWSAYAEMSVGSQVHVWSEGFGGRGFGPSAEYHRSANEIRRADASWITQAQWDGLSTEERRGVMRLCPVFAVEVRSPSQPLASQQRRMEEWIACGAQLGWLVDQIQSRLWVYRPGREPEMLNRPSEAHGDPELPGLVVNFEGIWT